MDKKGIENPIGEHTPPLPMQEEKRISDLWWEIWGFYGWIRAENKGNMVLALEPGKSHVHTHMIHSRKGLIAN